jgi:hypothetical protein
MEYTRGCMPANFYFYISESDKRIERTKLRVRAVERRRAGKLIAFLGLTMRESKRNLLYR